MEDQLKNKGVHVAIGGDNNGSIAIGSNITQSNPISQKPDLSRTTNTLPIEPSPLAAAGSDHERQQHLFQVLADSFNNGELRDLCFELGIEYDDLMGETRRDKARELVAFARRRDRLIEFERAVLRARPKAFSVS